MSLLSGFLSLLLIWWGVAVLFDVSPTTLPTPVDALFALLNAKGIAASLWVTLRTTLVALVSSILLGTAVAIFLSSCISIERFVLPSLVALQTVPAIVLAPIVVIAAPFGTTQVIVAFIVAFFPITVSTLQGLKSTPPVLLDAMRIYPVSWWQTLYYLRWPFALPFFFSGLKSATGLALVGAIIADMMTGRGGQYSGIGMRIQSALQGNPSLVFGEAIIVMIVGIVMLQLVDLFARLSLRHWRGWDG